ncbi:MAG: hypothetical protein EKK46_15665 [Rhodocyclaceae bacterium]|nr:MAG: hypothetical protein EKK46_15665 [Rhodocyclaceae bacterium]
MSPGLHFLGCFVLACCCGVTLAADSDCVEAATHDRLQQTYDELTSRFDLAGLTQQLIDIGSETTDLKLRLAACKRESKNPNQEDCAVLATRYADSSKAQASIENRLSAAIDMQEYIATVKVRLERSVCQ